MNVRGILPILSGKFCPLSISEGRELAALCGLSCVNKHRGSDRCRWPPLNGLADVYNLVYGLGPRGINGQEKGRPKAELTASRERSAPERSRRHRCLVPRKRLLRRAGSRASEIRDVTARPQAWRFRGGGLECIRPLAPHVLRSASCIRPWWFACSASTEAWSAPCTQDLAVGRCISRRRGCCRRVTSRARVSAEGSETLQRQSPSTHYRASIEARGKNARGAEHTSVNPTSPAALTTRYEQLRSLVLGDPNCNCHGATGLVTFLSHGMRTWIESLWSIAAATPEPPKNDGSNTYAPQPELVRVLASMVLYHSHQEVSA